MREKENALIIVPVFVKAGEDTTELKKRIEAMSELGKIHLINQGERIFSPEETKGRRHFLVQYEEKPLGIWGALEKAFRIITDDVSDPHLLFPSEGMVDILGATYLVVLNLAPLHFEAETLRRFICFAVGGSYTHVVGRRNDIATSLSDDPKIGRARALAECFLTVMASISQTGFSDCFEDGFSGLHAFSSHRYLTSQWGWVKRTTWGGALQNQLQTAFTEKIKYFPVPSPPRTHASTLGTDMKAVVNMLDQARNLSIFFDVGPEIIQMALNNVGWVFASQPWLEPETARDEILQLLEYYNKNTEKGEFLKI